MHNNDFSEKLNKLNELLEQLLKHLNISSDSDKKDTSQFIYNHKSSAIGDDGDQYLNLLDRRMKDTKKGRFISSGFAQLDELAGGFSEGELTVIGGRPGIGKTSLILSMILSHIINHVPVGIYSLELTKEALTDRIISVKTKIPITQLKGGKLTDKEYHKIDRCLLELSNSGIYFIDGAFFSIGSFSKTVCSLVHEKGVRILYVDYLQLMISGRPKRNREQEISELMRYLKSVAIEYKIPVIITSQMNRSVEWRGGSKRPILSDLRESGTIEEIADKVLLIYRPEVYGIQLDEEGNHTDCKAEVMVAKNRLGPTGDVILSFDKNFGLFENISWDKKVFPSLDLPDNPFNERPF